MATPGVGSDIEDICTRCGDTWHVVVAKVGERVVKVVCKLCSVQHHYRGDKNTPAAASGGSGWSAGRRKRTSKKAEPEPPPVPAFDPSKPPRPYSIRDMFRPGERMQHPTFGAGIVSAVPGPGKVDVVFPTGVRTLACAKTASTLERPTAVHVPIADRPPDAPLPSIKPHEKN